MFSVCEDSECEKPPIRDGDPKAMETDHAAGGGNECAQRIPVDAWKNAPEICLQRIFDYLGKRPRRF